MQVDLYDGHRLVVVIFLVNIPILFIHFSFFTLISPTVS